jgi:hypothetical protein
LPLISIERSEVTKELVSRQFSIITFLLLEAPSTCALLQAVGTIYCKFAKPSDALVSGAIIVGVHVGSNVITTSTDLTPSTCAALAATPSLRKPVAGQPAVVAVIKIQAAPSSTVIA